MFVSHKVPSRNSSKAVQTEDRTCSLDFPTPPPAITDANEYSEQAPDEYLSLKVKCLHYTFLPTIEVSSYRLVLNLSTVTSVICLFSIFLSINSFRSLTEGTRKQRQTTDIKTANSRR